MKIFIARFLIAAALFFAFTHNANATTWDEPWHREVVKQSDTFGLFSVVSVDHEKIQVKTIKNLAGMATPESFEIAGSHMFEMTSTHSDAHGETTPWLKPNTKVYLLLKKNGNVWQLASPSAGIDAIQEDGQVAATYRISFNQTMQPVAAYERVQSCIFRTFHEGICELKSLDDDLVKPLALSAAVLSPTASKADYKLFFEQHVALESAYLLKRSHSLETLEPFLDCDFFHQQVSAVRALSVSNESGRNQRLLDFIKDDSRTHMARAMAVVMVKEIGDPKLIASVKAYESKAPEEDSGLAVYLMDPRIGTSFPGSVRDAIKSL